MSASGQPKLSAVSTGRLSSISAAEGSRRSVLAAAVYESTTCGRFLMSSNPETRMSLASDEDGEVAFLLVDEAAPTREAVEAGWREATKREWGIEYEPYDDEEGPDIVRAWYKPDPLNDEQFIECPADDPDRSEEWWRFELPMERRRDAV
jgi:hypothetical protein